MTNELPEDFKVCIPKDHFFIVLKKLNELGYSCFHREEANFLVVRGKDIFAYKTLNCFIFDPTPEITITQFMSYTNKKETEIENKETEIENKESLKKLSECLDEALRLTDILSVNIFGKVF